MNYKKKTTKEVNEPIIAYNQTISFSTHDQLEEEDIASNVSLSPEQRFEYLHQLRKATHDLDLSELEKKELLNRIIINPPNGH